MLWEAEGCRSPAKAGAQRRRRKNWTPAFAGEHKLLCGQDGDEMRNDAQRQLDSFIDKFTPEVAALTRALLARMKARIPGAQILVYDNYNALAIGFCRNDKAGQAIISLAVMPKWVTLCFLWGKSLSDPHHLLKGEGSRVRHV